MRLRVSDDITARFPQLRIAVALIRGVDNQRGAKDAAALLQAEAARVLAELTPSSLDQRPEILAWRAAFTALGLKPQETAPAAEASLRALFKSGQVRSISPVVDIYRAAQFRWLIPIGGYDLEKLKGDISLRLSAGGEKFVPMGASAKEQLTAPGEVVYADEEKILTRRWNWRDGRLAEISPESRSVVLMAEAPSAPISTESLKGLLNFIASNVSALGGGSTDTYVWAAETQTSTPESDPHTAKQ